MQFDQVPRNRQAQPKTAMLPGEGPVGLAEFVKDERKKRRRNADAGVGHAQLRVTVVDRRGHLTWPPTGVNFTAFDRRFQATCCSRPASPMTGTDAAASHVDAESS